MIPNLCDMELNPNPANFGKMNQIQ